jgi:hypothetical protein
MFERLGDFTMKRWSLVLAVATVVFPITLSAQSYGSVNFVNETGERVAIQISGSPYPPGGTKGWPIKPGESVALRVAMGRQRLRATVIQTLGPFVTSTGTKFEEWVNVEPGVLVRITGGGISVSRETAGDTRQTAQSTRGGGQTPGGQLAYAGYSAQFTPIKALLLRGDRDSVRRTYREREQKVRESCGGKVECYVTRAGFLGLVEKGTLALDLGELDQSVDDFHGAEAFLQIASDEAKVSEWLKKGFNFLLETLTGHEEFSAYFGEGFERVLMLNYKTIAFMLKGERKAYNVTRRAIDWQNMERIRFEEKLRETETKLRDEDKGGTYSSQVQQAYRETDARASSVASAYVNPFGYYMAGVIQELEGRIDPSLVSNALISYRKALELNPRSTVIQQTVQDLERSGPAPRDGKLVHVVVNDGFVPEKMVLTQFLNAGTSRRTGQPILVPIKLPYYRPVPNRVQRIAVETTEGQMLADLSPVADVEAIVLRHQKDQQAFITLRIVLSGIRSTFWRALQEQGAVGKLLGSIMESIGAPDTRSWMTLPAAIQAARLYVPDETKTIVIATYDAQGTKLASQSVTLEDAGATFLYGRSLDDRLIVRASQDLWVNKLNPGQKVVSR